MKIAIFHELTTLSGARKVVYEYGKILKADHVVDLYYVDEKTDQNVDQTFSNVHFFQFKSSRVRIYRDSLELLKLFFLHKRIAKIINNNHYDLVFINPSRYSQAPFLLRFVKKSVYFCQEPLRIVYDPLMKISPRLKLQNKIYEIVNRKIRKIIDQGNIRKANLVLANSEFSRDNIYNAYGINAKVCYLGVDTDKFYHMNVKKIYDLLFIGDKSSVEGYDLLDAALNLYKKRLSVEYVIRNEYGESIGEDDLVKKINQSKIVLALSQNEPFGLIPVEAMSCGVAVIAVSEGGLRESVVDGVTGFLVKREKLELKEKIELLLKNDSLRNKLGKNSRERILAKFTWEDSVGNFLNLVSNNLK